MLRLCPGRNAPPTRYNRLRIWMFQYSIAVSAPTTAVISSRRHSRGSVQHMPNANPSQTNPTLPTAASPPVKRYPCKWRLAGDNHRETTPITAPIRSAIKVSIAGKTYFLSASKFKFAVREKYEPSALYLNILPILSHWFYSSPSMRGDGQVQSSEPMEKPGRAFGMSLDSRLRR